MTFTYNVKYNGVVYKAGEEVPMEKPQESKVTTSKKNRKKSEESKEEV